MKHKFIHKLERLKQRIINEFNLKKQANDLGISVWQTPSFLFIVMGVIIVIAMTGVYVTSNHYNSPEILVISESIVVALIFTIGNFIIKSMEEVAKSNKMKSEFVSIASHQLKTPISEMKWEIELLLSKFCEGLTSKQIEIVKEIAHSGEKMSRLVSDLLDVAKIDQGSLSLAKDKINIRKLIEEAIESQREFALASNVKIKESFKSKRSEIIGDKRRISVVLDNLISNAIKYIDGKGLVEIILEDNGKMVQISVRDNGVGIPKAEQLNIAEKFFRSNNSIKNRTDGTGLGLYIAKNIIERSGGSLWFESIENVGSEFYFTLPIIDKNKIKKVRNKT